MTLNDGRVIGLGQPPYVVAEVNSSHGGSVETAKRMIEAAAECGCDCVKFQSWSAESLYSRSYYAENPIARRFVTKFSLAPEQLRELAAYCRTCGVAFSSTPYSREEADFLVRECGAPFVKAASMELNNLDFLTYMARMDSAVILSTGMGEAEEIRRAVAAIRETGNARLCLLHCVSLYPPEMRTVNLRNITGLRREFPDLPVGFSDHSAGTELACAAVALGACVIEKHLTLDRKKIGMDNQMAMEPEEMKRLVEQCRNVFQALGSEERVLPKAELAQREKMRRSVVYTRDLRAGDVLRREDLDVKRPGTGFPPEALERFVGKTLRRDVSGDTLLEKEDV